MKLALFVFIILIASGCKEKQVNKPILQKQPEIKTDTAKRISIKKIGELRFRKSYSGHQNMNNKEYQKLLKSNPRYYSPLTEDSALLKKYKALGYLNNKFELLTEKLSSFKLFDVEKADTSFHLMDELHKKIACQIKKADSIYYYNLSATDSVQSAIHKIDNKFILPGLQFRTVDIIPGGFEEVILLDAYYIINGDNFDFLIYEITYK